MPNPESLYQFDRQVDTSTSGIEILRKFYCDPYDAHPDVIKHLRGFLTSEGKGADKTWTRHAPAQDPWIKPCYCTQARVVFPDPDVFSTATEPPDNGTVTNIPEWLSKTETFPPGVAGCHIHAHYRPLITAFDAADANGHSRWDWLDPTFTPGIRQIPWPEGLFIGTQVFGKRVPDSVPDEVATPLAVPVTDVSIRRILVGEPPWEQIKQASNAVNRNVWPAANSPMAAGLPRFEPNTLKLMTPDIVNMIDTEGKRWYEITYNFKWINEYSADVFDVNGERVAEDKRWVTWNHVFMKPWWIAQSPVGWYEVFRGTGLNLGVVRLPASIPTLAMFGGKLHNEVTFDSLFKLNP